MSTAESPTVILLRSADTPDPYVKAFADRGLTAVCIPVLTFRFPFQSTLADALHQTDRYRHLVLTSPRAVRALDDVFSEHPSLRKLWTQRAAFAVGPKTAAALRDLGIAVTGEDAGSADALVDAIDTASRNGPLLFLSGNRRRDTLPDGLSDRGISFDEVVVYETRVRTAVELPPPSVDRWLVFFSPSGLEAVRRTETVDASAYRLAAIGPTTAAALETAGLPVDAVAATPSPEALADALQDARSTESAPS
jgi:uroporphyrinogen-III synthase